jgi:chorismate mutase
MREVKKLRETIDEIDREMVKLLEKRVGIAREIGRIKRATGDKIYDPDREREVLGNISSSTKLDDKFVRGLFRSIIEYCKNEER